MTEIANREQTPAQALVASVRSDSFKSQVALALPAGMPADRFVRATVTALMQNPDLAAQASHDTIFTALIRSAQDGLVPDGREAALVVYGGKAQYLPMIGGYRKIAAEHGWALQTACVYENDEFEHELGLDPKLRHVQARPGVDRGDIIAAYCVARHRNGERLVEVMLRDELDKIRGTSKKPTSGPWKDWTDRMYEKTVGKRAFAKLPLYGRDEEIDRIRRLVADDPADAAAAFYGEPARAALTPPTSAPPTEGPAALPAGDGQDDDDPEPVVSAPSATDEEIDAAGATTIPSGDRAGKTIAEVVAASVGGDTDAQDWLLWALSPRRLWHRKSEAFDVALDVYVQHRDPALWTRSVEANRIDGQS
jgi:phage RecT family recombinase